VCLCIADSQPDPIEVAANRRLLPQPITPTKNGR
jgi:hypothetical protein